MPIAAAAVRRLPVRATSSSSCSGPGPKHLPARYRRTGALACSGAGSAGASRARIASGGSASRSSCTAPLRARSAFKWGRSSFLTTATTVAGPSSSACSSAR